jgi:uncharacterized integral membrane protein
MIESAVDPEIYQGQFGSFTITDRDRQSVVIYRSALMVAAVSFGIGTVAGLSQLGAIEVNASVLILVNWLYVIFSIALGIALATIHIYLAILHRTLQLFWAIGSASAIGLVFADRAPIAEIIYQQPLTLLGIGFTFAALTGIFFKEAFCFNRFETKILTFLVPFLLIGHLVNGLSLTIEAGLLAIWAGLFLVFAIRKAIQQIPPDLGDKSVFEYLKSQKSASSGS